MRTERAAIHQKPGLEGRESDQPLAGLWHELLKGRATQEGPAQKPQAVGRAELIAEG